MQVGTSKTKGLTISLQAAVYPGALAAGTLPTTTAATSAEIPRNVTKRLFGNAVHSTFHREIYLVTRVVLV